MPRPKGSKDRNRQYLWNRLKDQFGDDFDPIIRASENAIKLQACVEQCEQKDMVQALKNAIDAWLKIGEYLHPKLKAVEHSVDEDLQSDLEDLLKELAEAS